MSSKYDKTVTVEDEQAYQRRDFEQTLTVPRGHATKHHHHNHHHQTELVPVAPSRDRVDLYASSGEDDYEQWTTSKRKVNHKTRQVETRVSRQLLVEDGKVIADSGPQVTTRIKEDNKVEESEKEKAPKDKAKFDAYSDAPECSTQGGRVLGEKKEIQRVSREVREENMQYHDERFKELTGQDVHRRAMKAPHELITITDKDHGLPPRGKMVHYSNKGKQYTDVDEIVEETKLAPDGSITKEVKRTHHHEEESENELPDEKGEAERLRRKPVQLKSNRRRVDYVNDFDDTATPPESSCDEIEGDVHAIRREKELSGSQRRHRQQHNRSDDDDEEAFPRYKMGPLLNAVKESKPAGRSPTGSGRPVPLYHRRASESSDDERKRVSQHSHRTVSPLRDENRGTRQRSGAKSPASSMLSGSRHRQMSPAERSHLSHRNARNQRREEAAVHAHLTDEETERKSLSSSGGGNSHEKHTRHLQRQSTGNSSRNYYYGEQRRRSASIKSASSSSLSDPKEQMRRNGARSKDSGFRSPNQGGQIYAVSSKSRNKSHNRDLEDDRHLASPTPTAASMGQRSVKTTTTTVSAGLADRPRSRQSLEEQPARPERSRKGNKQQLGGSREKSQPALDEFPQSRSVQTNTDDFFECDEERLTTRGRGRRDEEGGDNISIHSSLGPNATTIKVPYKHEVRIPPQQHAQVVAENMALGEQPANRKRQTNHTDNIKRIPIKADQSHFDYAKIIRSVQHEPTGSRRQNVVDAYNVTVVQNNSPFLDSQQEEPIRSVSESIARLELLSSKLGQTVPIADNNNDGKFVLSDYQKHKALPAIVADDSGIATSYLDEDRVSLLSSCSLRSTRTYNVSTNNEEQFSNHEEDQHDDISQQEQQPVDESTKEPQTPDDEKLAAWIFDPRDNSTTAIVPPPKPPKPEVAEVETEELAEGRGGRSYYLELKEPAPIRTVEPKKQRPSSVDSFYSRWSSHNNLSKIQPAQPKRQSTPTKDPSRISRQMKPARLLKNEPEHSSSTVIDRKCANKTDTGAIRRQLPFGGHQLSNRSKSSSCLLTTSTKPSKYSIYGGLRKENSGNKPVPRLSYSRAIGPKSQRQIDAQPKVPSRYLKMR